MAVNARNPWVVSGMVVLVVIGVVVGKENAMEMARTLWMRKIGTESGQGEDPLRIRHDVRDLVKQFQDPVTQNGKADIVSAVSAEVRNQLEIAAKQA